MHAILRAAPGIKESFMSSGCTLHRSWRLLAVLTLCAAGVQMAKAQVNVTNPGNTTPGLQSSYTSLNVAITALNAQTAINGPVILTETGNENAPAGGYRIVFPTTTAGASATNTV